jgi:hypothetical protein
MPEPLITAKHDGQGEMPAPDGPQPPRRAGKFLHPGGSTPLGGFTIKRGVGSGGFGEIYYAVSDAGKEVALKLIRQHLEVELRGIRQCLNLKHPNLVAIYDIREDDQGNSWVVMEYIHGPCLEDVVAAHPHGLPVPEALAWIHGIGAGVAYLHDRGVVHRDLKPANIFLDEGLVKIGDYGLSKFISCSRRSGQTESIGTVHYMAPEVANGRYGKEIDIYALGIVLYELLTGRVPFDGESVGEVLMKHLTAEPDVSMLPEPYRHVVDRALAKDPAKRYASVTELLAGLPPPPQGTPGAPPGGYRSMPGPVPAGTSPHGTPDTPEESTPEEPVLRTLRQFYRYRRAAWDKLDPERRNFELVLGSTLLVFCAPLWLPAAMVLLLLYGAYRVIRAIAPKLGHKFALKFRRRRATRFEAATAAHNAARAGPPPIASVPTRQPAVGPARPGLRPRDGAAAPGVDKPKRQRLAELVQSLLVSALVAAAVWMGMVLVQSYRVAIPRPEQAAWLLLTSVLGAWAVLVTAKTWEGTAGDATIRRFILMVVGMGVGLLSSQLASLLMVELPHDPEFTSRFNYQLPPSFYGPSGTPLTMAFLASFGTLFLLVGWWRQADPSRTVRLRVWSMIVTLFAAWVVAWAWSFPQPWLAMVAGTISASVQLSSPWLDRRRGR